MAQDKPLVSIGMPAYNGEKHIRRALDSLLAQDYENFELIISDNASRDSTWAICEEYAARDKRIVLHQQGQNIGLMCNFQHVLDQAQGAYFMWAACDDFWLPSFVTAMSQELAAHPQASVCMCAVERVCEDGTTHDIVCHSGSADPSRMSSLGLALALAAGRYYHLYIYGLYRTDFLRRAFLGLPAVMASDRLFVCQVALATRFRYVGQVLHRRQVSDLPLVVRYQNEELGQIWKDNLAQWKMTLAVGPYLWRSNIIPVHRKLWIPLIVLCFGVRFLVYQKIYTLAYAISGRLLGAHGRKRLGQVVRNIWTR